MDALAKSRERSKLRYKCMKEQDLCYCCGKPANGKTECEECRRKRKQKYYDQHIASRVKNCTLDQLELVIDDYSRWAELHKVPKRNPIRTQEQEDAQLDMCKKCSVENGKHTKCEICPGVTGFMPGREPKGYLDKIRQERIKQWQTTQAITADEGL